MTRLANACGTNNPNLVAGGHDILVLSLEWSWPRCFR